MALLVAVLGYLEHAEDYSTDEDRLDGTSGQSQTDVSLHRTLSV